MAGTLVANTINTDTGVYSTNNAYSGIAKAWVVYNGSTQTVLGSFNISSITYSSAGSYILNFTTAMANANYTAVGMACGTATANGWIQQGYSYTYTTTACPIVQVSAAVGAYDSVRINVAIFGA
jgi:hypothetical protein